MPLSFHAGIAKPLRQSVQIRETGNLVCPCAASEGRSDIAERAGEADGLKIDVPKSSRLARPAISVSLQTGRPTGFPESTITAREKNQA